MNTHILPPIPIRYVDGDEPTHLAPWYFCGLPSCPCHTDPLLLLALIRQVEEGVMSWPQALTYYWNVEQQKGDTPHHDAETD